MTQIKDIPTEKKLWITWEQQRRNASMAEAMNAKYVRLLSDKGRISRYIDLIFRTSKILIRSKPRLLFVQNPSIVLSLLGVFWSFISRNPVIVDAHNAGIFPAEGNSRILNSVANYLIRKADYTIVTNQNLATYVESLGGKILIIPDPLPELPHIQSSTLDEKYDVETAKVFFICTWAEDEPYKEVIEAAQRLQQNSDKRIEILVSGRPNKEFLKTIEVPDNVKLLGFVPEEIFVSLLYTSDLILDLTTREDCLVCGAYEAVSAETPMVLSNTKTLKEYFSKGTVYSENDSASIATSILEALERHTELKKEISALKLLLQKQHESIINSSLSTVIRKE